MSFFEEILGKLSDGRFHSGEVLANELHISRAAVWKQLKKIQSMGLSVDAVRGKGYRLQYPLELLNTELIMDYLSPEAMGNIHDLSVHTEIDSTNRFLLQLDHELCEKGVVCLAERQTMGRGRRGRQWVSPFGANIYLSVMWRYAHGPAQLSGLSLALGVAVMRVLSSYAIENIGLKWPNDIYWQQKKLGGILVEIAGETNGPCTLVAGLGLNVSMTDGENDIDQPWTCLQDITQSENLSRNRLAAELIEQMLMILQDYSQKGFSAYQQEWQQWDVMFNKAVSLSSTAGERRGIVQGVDSEGGLLLKTSQGIEVINSGEVSLRLQS